MRLIPLTLVAALVAFPALAEAAAPSGDAKAGEKLFQKDGCWQCHGVSANGANASGPKLSRTALSFDAFLHQLRHPAAEMAPYEAAVLPDQSAADIYAYLGTLPDSPKAKDLPLLMGMGVK